MNLLWLNYPSVNGIKTSAKKPSGKTEKLYRGSRPGDPGFDEIRRIPCRQGGKTPTRRRANSVQKQTNVKGNEVQQKGKVCR